MLRSGRSAPPPTAGQVSRAMNAATLTTNAARVAHAPPPEKKCRGERTASRRSSVACWCSRTSVRVRRSGSTWLHPPVRNRRMRRHERAIETMRTMTVRVAIHSGATREGRFASSASTVAHTANGSSRIQWTGTRRAGAYTRRRCSCATRARYAWAIDDVPTGQTATRAAGASVTLLPPRRARTPRSSPSSAPSRARSGTRSRATSARTSMPRMSAPSWSSAWSC